MLNTKNSRNQLSSVSLSQLREIAGVTQSELARKMDKAQGNISKIETRGEMRLSTLREYLDSIGANVQIIATIGQQSYSIKIEDNRQA